MNVVAHAFGSSWTCDSHSLARRGLPVEHSRMSDSQKTDDWHFECAEDIGFAINVNEFHKVKL